MKRSRSRRQIPGPPSLGVWSEEESQLLGNTGNLVQFRRGAVRARGLAFLQRTDGGDDSILVWWVPGRVQWRLCRQHGVDGNLVDRPRYVQDAFEMSCHGVQMRCHSLVKMRLR